MHLPGLLLRATYRCTLVSGIRAAGRAEANLTPLNQSSRVLQYLFGAEQSAQASAIRSSGEHHGVELPPLFTRSA